MMNKLTQQASGRRPTPYIARPLGSATSVRVVTVAINTSTYKIRAFILVSGSLY